MAIEALMTDKTGKAIKDALASIQQAIQQQVPGGQGGGVSISVETDPEALTTLSQSVVYFLAPGTWTAFSPAVTVPAGKFGIAKYGTAWAVTVLGGVELASAIAAMTAADELTGDEALPMGSGESVTVQQLAEFAEGVVGGNAAHVSGETADQAKLASVGKVEELIGEGRRVEPITSTPATPNTDVMYLVHDSDEDITFGAATVPAGTTARVYYDGNGWVAVTDNGTPTPEAIMAAIGNKLNTANEEDAEDATIPTTAKIEEMMGVSKVQVLKRGWLTNLTPVSSITNQSNASKSIFGTFRYGNLQTSDELAGYALCTRNYITAQGTLVLGNVSDLLVDVFEYDGEKAFVKISRYEDKLTLDESTRFIKVRALKPSSESIVTLEAGKFNLSDLSSAESNQYVRYITTERKFEPNMVYEFGVTPVNDGDTASVFFGGLLDGVVRTSQANIVGDSIISADTINNIVLRDNSYPTRGVVDKYGIELSVYNAGVQSSDVRDFDFKLKRHTLSEIAEREISVSSDVYPVERKHDYFPSYPFLDGESGTNDKNFVFPFDWKGKHYLSKIILKLPPNYSADGEKVPVVAFRRGSFSFEGASSSNPTGMNAVVAFGEDGREANYEPVAGYIKNEGFAIFDFHPNGSRWNGYDGYGTPLNLHVLKCAYEWLEDVFNISHEQRFFMSKSNGGMISSVIPFHPELGIKAVAQLAPNCDTPKTMYRQSSNIAKAVAALQDMGFSAQEASDIMTDVFDPSNTDDEMKKQAFKPYILANMSKFAGYLQQYDGNITPTDISTIYDLSTAADSEHDTGWANVKRKCDVRVKTWCAGDDANVSYDICRHYIQTLQSGGSYAVLRTMPNDTGKHHSVDTSQLAPKSSGVTRLGISYTDVADAVIEVVQWFLGNNYVISHPTE